MKMKVLVAHDGSELADKALNRAAKIAAAEKGRLTVLTVLPDLCTLEIGDDDCRKLIGIMASEPEKRFEDLKEELAGKSIPMEIEIKSGKAAETILAVSKEKNIDMIVLGSHGRHGAKKFFLGSVSVEVVKHASCEVLVVK
jgi:nucleotide-binding universal stress UspA family protein